METARLQTPDLPLAMLVDDDIAVREALGELLDSVGVDSITFSSGREFLEAELPDRPACLVLDIRMPGLSGLELQHHLATKGIEIPIIFLTGHGDIPMSVQAMKAGAVEFLTKPVRDQTFLDAVSGAISTDIVQRRSANRSRESETLYTTLTVRERQVIKGVVNGLLNKQIAFDLGISEVTVKLHRSNMMKKMQCGSVSQLCQVWQALPSKAREEHSVA